MSVSVALPSRNTPPTCCQPEPIPANAAQEYPKITQSSAPIVDSTLATCIPNACPTALRNRLFPRLYLRKTTDSCDQTTLGCQASPGRNVLKGCRLPQVGPVLKLQKLYTLRLRAGSRNQGTQDRRDGLVTTTPAPTVARPNGRIEHMGGASAAMTAGNTTTDEHNCPVQNEFDSGRRLLKLGRRLRRTGERRPVLGIGAVAVMLLTLSVQRHRSREIHKARHQLPKRRGQAAP
jgi:hypothetical protein